MALTAEKILGAGPFGFKGAVFGFSGIGLSPQLFPFPSATYTIYQKYLDI
jgi:hypothetical protein